MKSDVSEKSESCCDDSDDESKEHVISSTNTAGDEPLPYEHIQENIYLIDKKKHINKEVRRMTCECELDDEKDDDPCGENCLNRLLLIECNHKCPCGDRCTNKRFQQGCKVKIEVFKTENKGWGVKTLEGLEENQFVMEYCGEVMNYRDFQKRAEKYDREKRRHYYFMTLRADEIIDATFKGSLSRFVNHSCEPNCVTEKWTVNGLLRIGFFTLRNIQAGEELTFDYQLQRYGKVAQTCYCEAPNCRGIIGGEKHTPLKNAIEKIVTTPISSPRRNKKKIGRSLEADFHDMSIEEELERLIGDHRSLTHSDQALKLSRLMVRAETIPQRIMLLKVLQNTTDQNCLKAFLRYQGLLLLWSWMVDAGSKPTGKLQLELLATLKYLPVTTKNQLEDSRVIKVVNKWAYKEITEQEMPSSCSSQEDNPEDVDRTLTQEDVDDSTSERAKKKLGYVQQLSSPGSSGKGGEDDGTSERAKKKLGYVQQLSSPGSSGKGGEDDSAEMDRCKKADKSPGELSEDDTKSTEDEQSLLSEELGDLQVAPLAYELLKQWSTLKEVYRIPKMSSKKAEVVIATSSTETPASKVVEQEQRSSKRRKLKISFCKGRKAMESLRVRKTKDLEHRKSAVSVIVSQPDSSGNIDDSHKQPETMLFTPPALMSLEVPIKSQGDPTKFDLTQKEEQERDPSHVGWKAISSTSADPSSSPEKGQGLSCEGSDSRHQVFGYKQRMGNGMGADQGFAGQPFNPNWPSSGKSKKLGKKAKWKQNTQFLPSQVGGQGLPSNVNPDSYGGPGNMINPQRQNWDRPSQQWQKGPQDANQVPFYGASDQTAYQGQFGPPASSNIMPSNVPPSNMAPCNIPPPNMSMPPHFPRNIPPPNFPPPQPVGFTSPAYPRPPPNVPLTPNLPPGSSPMSRFPNPQQVGMPQNMFVPNFPPPQVPFQSFNSPGAPQVQYSVPPSNDSPSKSLYSQPEALTKDSPPSALKSSVSSGPRPTHAQESSVSPIKPKKHTTNLPANWKTASDPQGSIYYYHTVTRQTQWEVPKDEGHDMDIDTPTDEEPLYKKKKPRTPTTPPGTPPRSPTLTFTTAAADTTQNRGVPSMSPDPSSLDPNSQKLKIKESFRMKLSNVIVNCLNPYYKVDCNQGRITNADDFKYLARRLTHGIMNKELQHVKSEEMLQCNDSVKVKTKEYIRAYMKKFDIVYKRS